MNVEKQLKVIEAYKNKTDICFCKIGERLDGLVLSKQGHVFNFSDYQYEIVQTAPEALYLHVGKSCVSDNDAQHMTTTKEHKILEKYVRVHDENTKYLLIGKNNKCVGRMFDSEEEANGFIHIGGSEKFEIEKWAKVQ